MARRTARRARPVRVERVDGGRVATRRDALAVEEPLELRLLSEGAPDERVTVGVTMRTPGHDFELAAGLLHAEGVITGREEVAGMSYCLDGEAREQPGGQHYNIVNVTLRRERLPELASLERHLFSTSACGVCGKAALDTLELRGCRPLASGPTVRPELIAGLPDALRAEQALFDSTGGLHAAALFTPGGELLCLREDIGRHNAVDKVIGWALLDGETIPLGACLLMVSGRVGFEIVQKALVAGIPMLVAISAPSSLAVETARAFDLTLIGFLRGERFNLYSGAERVQLGAAVEAIR